MDGINEVTFKLYIIFHFHRTLLLCKLIEHRNDHRADNPIGCRQQVCHIDLCKLYINIIENGLNMFKRLIHNIMQDWLNCNVQC